MREKNIELYLFLGIVTGNPRVPLTQPVPVPVRTCTHVNGYGFWQVRVAGIHKKIM